MTLENPQSHNPGTDDGWHGIIKEGGQFPPEEKRYHLYIGLFCPFAQRANVVRYLNNLTDIIDLSVVLPYPKPKEGFIFPQSEDEYDGSIPDAIFHSKYISELYLKNDPEYKGRFTVPVLIDTKTGLIVNNESAEILRSLPQAFNQFNISPTQLVDLYPLEHRAQVDIISVWLQSDLNAGVYKAGFAKDQAQYDDAVVKVFGALNKLEILTHANGGPFLLGRALTELDARLYTTLVRFDIVYVQLFRCNLGMIRHDYPVLHEWLKNLYWNVKGFRETTNFDHIRQGVSKYHVYCSKFN
jgi:putative glutathione S-transferase